MDFVGLAMVFVGAVVFLLLRLLLGAFLGVFRGRRIPPDVFDRMRPDERLLQALQSTDPCRLGLLGAQDVYPRAVAILGPNFSHLSDDDLRAELTEALRSAGCGFTVSAVGLRRTVRLIRP